MKQFLLVLLLSLLAFITFAQRDQVLVPKQTGFVKVQENNDVQFGCPKGDYCAPKEGKCPTHNLTLISEGSFYCELDKISNNIGGVCPVCGKEMKKMDCKKPEDKREKLMKTEVDTAKCPKK